jgi:hypothetical protein
MQTGGHGHRRRPEPRSVARRLAAVAARQRIVEGPSAWAWPCRALTKEASSSWTRSARPATVSSLLVVLCGEQATQQVVNTGSLYL